MMNENRNPSICRTRKPGDPYEPCFCYVHDRVAELLGIVSTTGRDFRPDKTPQDHAAEARRLADRAQGELKKIKKLQAEAHALMNERQRPIVLGGGMEITPLGDDHGTCTSCKTSIRPITLRQASVGRPVEQVCDLCHDAFHRKDAHR